MEGWKEERMERGKVGRMGICVHTQRDEEEEKGTCDVDSGGVRARVKG